MDNKKEIQNAMSKDPQYWKWMFYFNRKDSRILVPKYNPARGWTLNFANPLTYILLVSAIGLILLIDKLV